MRICLIIEGAYPYVSGGVSSWVQALITSMPEHEFVLYTIGAEERMRGKYKYSLPPNVVGIQEVFLDAYTRERGKWGKNYRLSTAQRESLISLLAGEGEVEWAELFDLLHGGKINSAINFLMSRDYFNYVQDLCLRYYPHVPFTEMFWTIRSMLLPLFEIIRHQIPEADIYHCTATGYSGVIGSLGKHLYNKPLILTEHGIYSREREEEIIKADWVKGYFKDVWIHYFYALSRCTYQYADKVVTLFQRNKEIQIEVGCDGDKIDIIPNGVKVEQFADLPGKSNAETAIHIGAIARIVPIKDIKTMLHSYAIVKESIPDAKLYIMGPTEEDPDYYEECRQLVDILMLEDVIFTGEVQVREYIGRMDILLLSSISEGQPLVLLEGMAAGKPFVTTDVGSCKELLLGDEDEFGEAGFVAPVMHYERIGKAIITLCRDRTKREAMGIAGRRRVTSKYRHDQFIKAYKQIYSALEV